MNNGYTIKITLDGQHTPRKLADAEIHFTEGIFAGLKLIGFGVWSRVAGSERNVTFPARQYQVNGERRSFALLRPTMDSGAQDALKAAIVAAYDVEAAAAAEVNL